MMVAPGRDSGRMDAGANRRHSLGGYFVGHQAVAEYCDDASSKTGHSAQPELTTTLLCSERGDPRAFDRLFALVYQDFRALAKSYLARERHTVTLQPTALVNEAYIRLVDQTRVDWKGRTHFFAVGAMAMRRILVNRAIAAKRLRRGGGQIVKVELVESVLSTEREEDVLAVDEALKDLAKLNKRHAKIVEMRFFGGLTVAEIADSLGVSASTVEKDLRFSSAWLKNNFRR
jgi:RNA polymerase sigma-70 factor (ECF subfamily)